MFYFRVLTTLKMDFHEKVEVKILLFEVAVFSSCMCIPKCLNAVY